MASISLAFIVRKLGFSGDGASLWFNPTPCHAELVLLASDPRDPQRIYLGTDDGLQPTTQALIAS